MMNYKSFLIESKNTHMEHIEDLIFNEGVSGARTAINFLQDLRNMLAGHAPSAKNITVKWDGAPAIFAGIDPSDDKFFIAKKGLFNIKPVMYKSQDDINNDNRLASELKKKFKIAFNEFSKLGIKSGVYQGDLMFTTGDVKVEDIENETYYTFQPNTIVYAIPVKSQLGKIIHKAKIGVVWHTTYTGKNIRNMKASFGKNITKNFKKVRSIWMDDATYKDESGTVNFTKDETTKITEILSKAGIIFKKISSDILQTISSNEELKIRIKTYNNTYVREGNPFPNPNEHVHGLFNYITDYYDEEIKSKNTPVGKQNVMKKKKEAMIIFQNPNDLINIFEFMNYIIQAKSMIVNKLNMASKLNMNTFLRTSNGFKATSQEGFVAIDDIKGVVKLVDRLEFSRANFSANVIKGWKK